MQHFEYKKFVPYTAKQMFNLVMDIESYPEFLPWCSDAKIIEKVSDVHLLADLTIRFNVFTQKYRSQVTSSIEAGHYFVTIDSDNEIFDILSSKWLFTANEGGADIEFIMDIGFRSSMFKGLMTMLFENMSQRIIAKFEARAKQVYSPFNS
jgi:coenzyme Q-binding protein COQ10